MPPSRAGKHLSGVRTGTVLNLTSKQQESQLGEALEKTVRALQKKHGLELVHKKTWTLGEMAERLQATFPEEAIDRPRERTWIQPDGGVISIEDEDGRLYPVLISEVKSQGTNDQRAEKGLSKQALGNAIERLGKNVIGIRAAMLGEEIVPFVCFGSGVDFAKGSSILGRVQAIAMFGRLNKIAVHNTGPNGELNRGTFYFREKPWTVRKMSEVLTEVGSEAIAYYQQAYPETRFVSIRGRT